MIVTDLIGAPDQWLSCRCSAVSRADL